MLAFSEALEYNAISAEKAKYKHDPERKLLMKKLLIALISAILVLMLFGCNGDKPAQDGIDNGGTPPHTHTFAADWTADSKDHWKACTTEGCTGVSEKSAHSFGEGEVTVPAQSGKEGEMTYTCTVCSAAKRESIPALPAKMSEADWQALFAFENVRIDCAVLDTEMGESYYYLVDGEDVLEVWDDEKSYTDRSVLAEVDFSASYELFNLGDDGAYTAASVTVNYMDIMEVELTDVIVTLADGKIASVTYAMDFGALGSVDYVYTFSLWGEVEVDAPDTSLSAEALEYALARERFENFTLDVDMVTYMFNGDSYVQITYDENYEVVDTDSGTSSAIKESVLDAVRSLISDLNVSDFEYNALFGEYSYLGELDGISELTVSFDEEGNLSTVYVLAEDESVISYWFYDYGTTVLE